MRPHVQPVVSRGFITAIAVLTPLGLYLWLWIIWAAVTWPMSLVFLVYAIAVLAWFIWTDVRWIRDHPEENAQIAHMEYLQDQLEGRDTRGYRDMRRKDNVQTT